MPKLTNLEFFVLAMVQVGLQTPYDLKMKAGLSLGSTIPLLARLEKAQLISGAKIGSRNSRRFSITPEGRKSLKRLPIVALEGATLDVDSALRAAYLAWRFGNRRRAARVLEDCSEHLKSASLSRRSDARRLSLTARETPPSPDAHRWLKMSYEALRLEADASVLSSLARHLGSSKKTKSKKTQ
jgi:DNA-binding PadR family transcriptional regulator